MNAKGPTSARFILVVVTALLLVSAGFLARGAEKRTILTVYQNGPSLVVNTEEVSLTPGENSLTRLIPSAARPETLFVTSAEAELKKSHLVPALTSKGRLLEELIGTKVKVSRGGESEQQVEGKLVTVLDGDPLIESADGKFELVKNPAQFKFDAIDENKFSSKLVMELISQSGGETDLTVAYQLSGLSWQPQYVGFLNEEREKLYLRGTAHIMNETDRSFRGVELNLLAGEPAREKQSRNALFMAAAQESAQAKGVAPPQKVFEYYRYTPDFPVEVPEKVATRVKFLERDSVDFKRYYRFEPASSSAVTTMVELDNSEETGLGLPLAGGTVRIYEDTAEKTFLGADALPNTPQGKEVKLELGDAFDVEGTRKRMTHEKVGERIWKDQITLELKNRKEKSVQVKVIEGLRGSWEILKSSHDYEVLGSDRIQYEEIVPAEGSLEISYTVQYRY